MLDQNTDRMWFVIGAVIVGAAIIFIANGTLPDIFANVSSQFKDASETGTQVVSELEPNVTLPLDHDNIYSKHNAINMLSMSNIENGGFNYLNGAIMPDSYALHLDFERTNSAIPVEPSTEYYISHRLDVREDAPVGVEMAWMFLDKDMNYITGSNYRSYDAIGTKYRVVLSPDNAKYFHIRYGHQNATWNNRNYFMAPYDLLIE